MGVRRALAAGVLAALLAAPAAAQESRLIVVVGLGGDPGMAATFHEWAATLVDAAKAKYGLPASDVVYLDETPARDPARITGRSTRENVEAAVTRVAAASAPGDRVFIVLIGHGSDTEGRPRFNLPGPDMTAADFARLLDGLAAQAVVLVDTTSASGPFVEALSGRDRTIVTATATGGERNAPRFGGFFVAALAGADAEADVDKDGRVSILEAFGYAKRKVAEAYQQAGNLLAEHALLDDNGDRKGSLEPDPLAGDGALARTMFLTAPAAAAPAAPSDPALAALYAEQKALEDRIGRLRALKGRMPDEEYQRQLEPLLLDLARKTREIRELEKKKGGA